MKRFIYLAAVASIALVGCAKNEATVVEGNSDQLISFASPVVGLATKANVGYPTIGTAADADFWVIGKLHQSTYSEWSSTTTYMNTKVKYSESAITGKKAWFPVDASNNLVKYYWPKNTDWKLTFLAYAPDPDNITATSIAYSETGLGITEYTVPNSARQDLLVSRATYNQVGSGAGTTTGTTPKYDGVNIQFQHALSSINFTVKTAADYSATTKVWITNITLNTINNKGTFNQNIDLTANELNVGPSAVSFTPTWTPVAGTATYTPFSDVEQLVTKDATSVGTEQILLPQTLTAGTQTATITFKMQTGLSSPISWTSDPINLNNGTITKWEPQKKYIYNIVFGLDEIYFAPEVIDWLAPTVEGTLSI